MINIYLVRHGETQENLQQILQGRLPGHLTARGREQAYELGRLLATNKYHFDLMLYSDLQRTHDTAQIINNDLRLPCYPCALLRERDWGSFTGKSIETARNAPIPNDAESVEQMFERAQRFLIYIKENFDNKNVLAVGHGLFNRTILAAYKNLSIRDIPRIQNAEIRHLAIDQLPQEWTIHTDDSISAN